MRIILMRHGKPSLPPQKSITSEEFKNWIESYNSAEICENSRPDLKTIEVAKSCNIVLCSSLNRSLKSAAALEISEISMIEHNFREMEMPWGKVTNLKINPKFWAAIFRIMWFFGYSKNSESFREAKLRASSTALLLASVAKENSSVLFVGHAMFNRYISKYLLENGWQVRKNIDSNYWGFGILEKKHNK